MGQVSDWILALGFLGSKFGPVRPLEFCANKMCHGLAIYHSHQKQRIIIMYNSKRNYVAKTFSAWGSMGICGSHIDLMLCLLQLIPQLSRLFPLKDLSCCFRWFWPRGRWTIREACHADTKGEDPSLICVQSWFELSYMKQTQRTYQSDFHCL